VKGDKMNNYYDTPIYFETEKISHFIPDNTSYEYLQIPKTDYLMEEEIKASLIHAINNPLESVSLKELVNSKYRGNHVTILIDDHTRPNIHTRALLPVLEQILTEYGVNKSDIRLMVATGSHAPPTGDQIQDYILGGLYSKWKDRIWLHDCDKDRNHINLGFSAASTPILIEKRVFDSDLIIPLSDCEYHYFAGVAGSVKLILPGISHRKTIRSNHSRIFDLNTGFKENCRMGNIDGNVSIQDIREIVTIIQKKHEKSIFVIDAILDKGNFVNIYAGDPIRIHDNSLNMLSKIRDVSLNKLGDLVIIGKPSVNYYQAGKGVNAASHAVKKGGTILLLAGCPEGIGPSDYLETMQAVKERPYIEAMQWIIKNKCTETTFEIGIQNAVDLFRILELTKGNLFLYSPYLDEKLMTEVFHVNLLPKISPEQAVRNFVLDFISKNSNPHIVIYEDNNLLNIS
jgi:nickel-dependent lactate racemase